MLWGLTVYQLPFKAVLKIGGIGAQPQKKRFAFSGVIGIAIALFGIIGIGFVKLALAEEGNSGCGVDPFYLEHSLLCAKPEFGIDIGATRTQFEEGHGDKMLNRNQHPINFFFGFNTTENFGVEFGYGETRRKHKQVSLGPGEFAPGGDIMVLSKISHPYNILVVKINKSYYFYKCIYKFLKFRHENATVLCYCVIS